MNQPSVSQAGKREDMFEGNYLTMLKAITCARFHVDIMHVAPRLVHIHGVNVFVTSARALQVLRYLKTMNSIYLPSKS